MKFSEDRKNLFEVNNYVKDPYVLAHCVSADFAMGGGIAKSFQDNYNLRTLTREKYSANEFVKNFKGGEIAPVVVKVGNFEVPVYNLITKRFVFQKPFYSSVQEALEKLRDDMIKNDYKKLAIPRIACGIDGLDWGTVKKIIKDVFKDTDITIKVCYL